MRNYSLDCSACGDIYDEHEKMVWFSCKNDSGSTKVIADNEKQ